MRKKLILCNIAGLIFFVIGIFFIPHKWCERQAGIWYEGKNELQTKMALGVEKQIKEEIEKEGFSTGSQKFDGEWYFGTYMMAGMGFGQMALEHPERKKEYVKLMEICIDNILSEEVRAFDTMSWGEDPLDSLEKDSGHAAYLGYSNLLLSLHRYVEPDSKYSALNDTITNKLSLMLGKSNIMLLETYPYEVYPVDNCSVIASIALYDKATGKNHKDIKERWTETCRRKYIDHESGLLYQSVYPDTGKPLDSPRGSGTALGIYFLSFMDKELSYELYGGLKKELAGGILGFGAIREYPPGIEGRGDIDSGPIILSYGISATGFSIAGARIHGDRELFSSLYSTAYLFGGPVERDEKINYVMGGPLGNAIMFAMLTAQPKK